MGGIAYSYIHVRHNEFLFKSNSNQSIWKEICWRKHEYVNLLYNFVKKCPNNSQNKYKYTAIFRQLVICILPVWRFYFLANQILLQRCSISCKCSCMLIGLSTFQSFFIIRFLFQKQLYNKFSLWDCFGVQYRCIFLLVLCKLTRPAGSSKYCRTHKNIQRYWTPKHPIRYIYILV